jgi:FAD/FMN-containing dehydrogenase
MAFIRTDPVTRARYSQGGGIQRLLPEAVARPENLAELEQAIVWARERGLSITPRGAGSAMDGGSLGRGVVLDLTAYDRGAELTVDPVSQTVRTAPGVTLDEVARAAALHRLRLGPDPSSSPWATVAGAISTNAAGPRTYRLGAMDQWVVEVELMTADGPLVLRRSARPDLDHPVVRRFERDAIPVLEANRVAVASRWPRTRKNTAGYALDRWWWSEHLLDLVIGSEGTLGVITGATLRLEPIPACTAALRVALADRHSLPAAIDALEKVSPTTIELLDRSFIRLVEHRLTGDASSLPWHRVEALLLVDLEGATSAELDERVAEARLSLAAMAIDQRVGRDTDEIEALWSIRHAASPILAAIRDGRRSLQVVEDGCVPIRRLGEYLDAVERACTDARIDAVMFGHAGDGHVHVNLLPDVNSADWLARVRGVYDSVNATLIRLGGTPAGEHGAGRLRAGILEARLGPEAMACFAAIKRAFDPDGIFNPGVIIPDGSDPFAGLKVGTDAPGLPDGIATELWEIEQERRWGVSRWSKGGPLLS